jgi:hypothetical protein
MNVMFDQRLTGLLAAMVCFCACLVFAPVDAGAVARGPFGIEHFTLETTVPREVPEDSDPGSGEESGYRVVNEPYSFTQAGGHPVALTLDVTFPTEEFVVQPRNPGGEELPVTEIVPTQDAKDIVTVLPPGLLGNPTAVPRCSLSVLTSEDGSCSPATQVGLVKVRTGDGNEHVGPIYDVVPEAGQSAELALHLRGVIFFLTAHIVRSGQGYGFTVVSSGDAAVDLVEAEVTFWGVPAESRYDWMRGLECDRSAQQVAQCRQRGVGGGHVGGERAGVTPVPFLTMPTDCAAGPENAVVRVDSWEEPGHVGLNGQYDEHYKSATWRMPGVTGCDRLSFSPEVEVMPDTLLADAPMGLGMNVRFPQPEAPEVNGAPHLRNAVVTLPEGVSISPGIADGIEACNESGPEGINFSGPESEEVALDGEWQLAAGHCPDASTVGTAEAISPDLAEPIKGHVYLARPLCGGAGEAPCTEADALDGHLYQLYLEFGGKGPLANAGVNSKLHGFVEADPATGQLTTKFLENPQVPVSELKLRLNGGPRAPVDNPAVCGPAVTTTDFTPWSAPGTTPLPEALAMPGTPDATPSSFFEVEGCAAGGAPFSPGLLAGTVTPQAGQFSAFTLNLSRGDREQFVKGVQIHTPPGLLGMLSNVQLCGEQEADDGHCPASSKIGTTRVASGAGSHPFEIEGTVYLTGPHDGAPFGLSIVTPAVAGPFNLGLVVVRARIDVNPNNSTLTVTTDETGPYALPQIVFGIPLRLKRITVDIDRPNFMFNPTNCDAQQVTAAIAGSENAVANLSSPFAVGGCRSLAFKPKFAVSTSARTSRANGASLDAKLSYPAGAVGSEANIASVKVELPKQLPSRLTTLQKACAAAQFEANPAGCPAASIVGAVRASTPLLGVGLSGPAYFVSHGGEAFPSLIVVLQGEGVRVDLTGSTFISKAGITSSTFKTVPDVPVNTFELYLPEGRYSALTANGNLCASKLAMPTTFVAQNGAEIHQTTKISVTGCSKIKTAQKKKKARTARHRHTQRRGRLARTHSNSRTSGRAGR